MKNLSYLDILKNNKTWGQSLVGKPVYEVAVFSNITVNLIKEILECTLRSKEINAEVTMGDYDNIPQDSMRFHNARAVVIFWEVGNLIEGFHHRVDTMDEKQLEQVFVKVKAEIDMTLTRDGVLFYKASPGQVNRMFELGEQIAEKSHEEQMRLFNKFVSDEGIIKKAVIFDTPDMKDVVEFMKGRKDWSQISG